MEKIGEGLDDDRIKKEVERYQKLFGMMEKQQAENTMCCIM
jgi:hypothetical protein